MTDLWARWHEEGIQVVYRLRPARELLDGERGKKELGVLGKKAADLLKEDCKDVSKLKSKLVDDSARALLEQDDEHGLWG